MLDATLVNYQEDGWEKSRPVAAAALVAARHATPEHLREQFRSHITWCEGGYAWAWILK